MKKVLAIVLSALLLVAALAGCTSKSETASNDTPLHRYCCFHRWQA